jgi:hypothetical protein
MNDKKCCFCQKLGDSFLKCSACGTVAYWQCNTNIKFRTEYEYEYIHNLDFDRI